MNDYEFRYNNRFQQNNKDKLYLYLFRGQVILNAIIIFTYSALTQNLYLFIPIFLNLLALKVKLLPTNFSERFNFVFQIFFQAFIIAESYFYLISFSTRYYDWTLPSSIGLLLVSILVMYIPYTVVFFTPFRNKLLQLLLATFAFAVIAMGTVSIVTYGTILGFNPFISIMTDSRFLGTLVFLIMVLIMMRKWGYPYPHMRLDHRANWNVLIFLLLLCAWFTMWNAFGGGNSLLSSLYTFNFKGTNFSIRYLLSGLEAGIAEELLFRYVFLTVLLVAFKNFRFKIFYAAILSSLCFGIIHLSNVSAGQSLANTIDQVIFACGMGLLMCGIYLYTNLFYLPVIFHTLLDTLAFTTSGEMMSGKVTSVDALFTIIETIIFALIAIGLLISVYRRGQTQSYKF